MAGFIPKTKTFREGLEYGISELGKMTPGQIAGTIAAGGIGAAVMHNDEHPILSSGGGYMLGESLAVAGMIATNAMKYIK